MTKPRLEKVRALFYVFQHVIKEAAPILTQPHVIVAPVIFAAVGGAQLILGLCASYGGIGWKEVVSP